MSEHPKAPTGLIDTSRNHTLDELQRTVRSTLRMAGVHVHELRFLNGSVPAWFIECRKGTHAICGILRPRAITIRLDGVDVLDVKLKRGLTPHEFAMTVAESFPK